MSVLVRLMVDRRASSSAGLRSASLAEGTTKANLRSASPLIAGRQFESPSWARRFMSAAVAHLWRSAGAEPQDLNRREGKELRKPRPCFLSFLLFDWQPVNCFAAEARVA